ncbi:LacI family repressor for deo operon, udp, cdd, tsx, nupC, and nupG [Evansella vedderi]|uniref:LacI family repressor for deo operon, udp, cdd, tsx, nupC, and nupG n=1 Tax=Evansella vedderi TaxID=38282 RepID=A0ABT9ZRS1_9BACI|nr:LacI family DNA-binding transcriptional regulator [Evansella vedderi]MDQ0253163.1 LacI family repressor for deo operon, udp, cdd, tsx, nupC, and nupG [Evansella vedderi]
MTKMIDVANFAGVSTATVSRVLANDPKVKEKTKQKVLKAVDELNYIPNSLARNFRKRSSKNILVVVPTIANPLYPTIISGIQSVAREHNYQVILGDISRNFETELAYLELIRDKAADGVILLAAELPTEEFIEAIKGLPVVLGYRNTVKEENLHSTEDKRGENKRINIFPTVNINNVKSVECVIDHLVQLGHKKIAFFNGPKNSIVSIDRLKGYKQGLVKNGCSFEPELIYYGDWTMNAGYELALELLQSGNDPTAIFTVNDETAVGAIKALKENGLRIPEDIAIVGFDNIELAKFVDPPLTTIAQPKFEFGVHAMELLLKVMNGETISQENIVLESHLIIRESCGSKIKGD